MPVPPNERESPSPNWGIAFTRWKLGVCLLAVGSWIGTVAILDFVISGETTHATTQRVNGGVEFTITSFKDGWLNVATWLGLFCIPGFVFWWFWPQLSKEYFRFREKPITDSLASRVGAFCIIGPLIAFALWIILIFVVLQPLNAVYRVTIRGDDLHVESLYRKWDMSRRNIQHVNVTRRVGEGRGGPCAEYRTEIQIRNGDRFRTLSDVVARPPGGDEDKRYKSFFAQLHDELTRRP